jgi:hypothetical protein
MHLPNKASSLHKKNCPPPVIRRHRSKSIVTLVEFLERRVLLSVSATTLRTAFSAGAQSTFQITGASTDETETITDNGPAQYNGQNVEDILETTDNTALGTSTSTTVYEAFTSAGFVSYGESSTTTSASATEQNETFDSPYLLEIPSSLTAGKPIVSQTTSVGTQTTTVIGGGSPIVTTSSNVLAITIRLTSNTQQSVTVPAGTFKAYQIDETTVVNSMSNTVELWYAPNVGEVKAIIGSGQGQETEVLTEYPHPTAGLTASLSGSLTDSTVETTPLKGLEKITFTPLGAAVEGTAAATVLLSPDSNAADSVFTLATITADLNLKPGQHKTLPLHLPKTIPASVVPFPQPPQTFYVLIQVVDTDGNVYAEESGLTLTVAAPQVDLSGSFVNLPKAVASGKLFTFIIQIANLPDANVPAQGPLQIDFNESPDGISDFVQTGSISRPINLKPGQTRNFIVHGAMQLPATFLEIYLDPLGAFENDVNPENEIFKTMLNVTT